jgi:hypothetical protein
MPTLSWQGRLDAAASSEDVVSVARDYLASFTPYELAAMPGACRPPSKLYDGEDLTTYAFELVRHSSEHDAAEVAEMVHKFAHFFSSASIRLSEIQAARPEDSQGQDTRQSA